MKTTRLMELTFRSCPNNLQQVRKQVRQTTSAVGCSEKLVQQIAEAGCSIGLTLYNMPEDKNID